MNMRQEILDDRSKPNIVRLAKYIGDDKAKFSELVKLLDDEDKVVSQRAAWVLSYCAEFSPELIDPYMAAFISLLDASQPDAIKRNILRLLQFRSIPAELQGEVVTRCFDLLQSAREPVAIKAFGMTVLYNICKEQPDIAPELCMVIEDLLPHGTAAIRHRGNKILAELRQQ